MARKRKRKRRGFWGWLTGHQGEAATEPSRPEADEGQPAGPSVGRTPGERAEQYMAAERACAVCGHASFHWGWLESGLYGAGRGPAAATQPKYVKRKTRFGDYLGLRARICENCGHVDIFALPEEDK